MDTVGTSWGEGTCYVDPEGDDRGQGREREKEKRYLMETFLAPSLKYLESENFIFTTINTLGESLSRTPGKFSILVKM